MKPETEVRVLHYIPPRVGVPLGWLAERLGIPRHRCSALVHELEARGLVSVHRAPGDLRRLAIVLTRKGESRVAGSEQRLAA